MTVGENIKLYRKKKCLSQQELGEKIGMIQQRITQYENGVRNPRPKTLRLIADALEVSVQDLQPDEQPTAQFDFFDIAIEWIQGRLPAGYTVRVNESDQIIRIEYPDGDISQDITLASLQESVNTVMEFFRFTLEKYRRKRL